MPHPLRPFRHTGILDRLRREGSRTFPEYGLTELKATQAALHFKSHCEALGRALEQEGYRPGEERLARYPSRNWNRNRALVLIYLEDLRHAIWGDSMGMSPNEILTFLEINPFLFRSGYLKIEMIQILRRSQLDPRGRARVGEILRSAVLGGREVSLPHWWRLVELCDVAAVEAIAREGLQSEREDVKRKATILLLRQRGKTHRIDGLLRRTWRARPEEWPEAIAWARGGVDLEPIGTVDLPDPLH